MKFVTNYCVPKTLKVTKSLVISYQVNMLYYLLIIFNPFNKSFIVEEKKITITDK